MFICKPDTLGKNLIKTNFLGDGWALASPAWRPKKAITQDRPYTKTETVQSLPCSCINQARQEHFQSLVMRVLLEWNGLERTSPRVKSSKVCESWCFTFKRFRYKAFSVSLPGLVWRFIATLRFTLPSRQKNQDGPSGNAT